MSSHTDEITKRLETDIAIIKEAIRTNNGNIRKILMAPKFGSFFIAFGVAGIVLPLIWYFSSTIILPLILTVCAVIGLSAWKVRQASKAIKLIDSEYTYLHIIEKFSAHPIALAQGLVLVLTIFLSIMAARSQNHFVIPAIVSGGLATIYLFYIVAFLLSDYVLITLWLYMFLVVSLFFPAVSPLIMTSIGIGGGFFLFGIVVVVRGDAL